MKYTISIKFLDGKARKNDLVLLRNFTGLPFSELNIDDINNSIFLGTILNEEFYSGVKEILVLSNTLESNYQLFCNSSKIEKFFLENIANKIKNIDLSNIR